MHVPLSLLHYEGDKPSMICSHSLQGKIRLRTSSNGAIVNQLSIHIGFKVYSSTSIPA